MGIIFALDGILASIFCLGVFSDHVFDLPLGCMVTQNRVVLSPIITSNREFNTYAHLSEKIVKKYLNKFHLHDKVTVVQFIASQFAELS